MRQPTPIRRTSRILINPRTQIAGIGGDGGNGMPHQAEIVGAFGLVLAAAADQYR